MLAAFSLQFILQRRTLGKIGESRLVLSGFHLVRRTSVGCRKFSLSYRGVMTQERIGGPASVQARLFHFPQANPFLRIGFLMGRKERTGSDLIQDSIGVASSSLLK
jgi:hypothetical protein